MPAFVPFLDIPDEFRDYPGAEYVVLPVPYEATVTYKGGAAGGPAVILEASQEIEEYDEELRGEFFRAGIHTMQPVESEPTPARQVAKLRDLARAVLRDGKFLLTLGGEHSITPPLVVATAEALGRPAVLQVDAHSDLRDVYRGERNNHACAMRRVLETTEEVAQVGIRSFARADVEQCPEQVRRFVTAEVIAARDDWVELALDRLPPDRPVYVTIDVDGLDPSIAPGVGTPEPGGLTWRQLLGLLRALCARRRVVAADIVEVRPIPPNHITEALAARLAYKIVCYTQAREET